MRTHTGWLCLSVSLSQYVSALLTVLIFSKVTQKTHLVFFNFFCQTLFLKTAVEPGVEETCRYCWSLSKHDIATTRCMYKLLQNNMSRHTLNGRFSMCLQEGCNTRGCLSLSLFLCRSGVIESRWEGKAKDRFSLS